MNRKRNYLPARNTENKLLGYASSMTLNPKRLKNPSAPGVFSCTSNKALVAVVSFCK